MGWPAASLLLSMRAGNQSLSAGPTAQSFQDLSKCPSRLSCLTTTTSPKGPTANGPQLSEIGTSTTLQRHVLKILSDQTALPGNITMLDNRLLHPLATCLVLSWVDTQIAVHPCCTCMAQLETLEKELLALQYDTSINLHNIKTQLDHLKHWVITTQARDPQQLYSTNELARGPRQVWHSHESRLQTHQEGEQKRTPCYSGQSHPHIHQRAGVSS